MTEKGTEEQTSICVAANLLKTEADLLGVKKVNWENRNAVQEAYKKLMKNKDFIQSIEASRPNAIESHLIFTPHLSGDECLAWCVYPYGDVVIQPEGSWKVVQEPNFAIDAETGGISMYFNENGDMMLCGYD